MLASGPRPEWALLVVALVSGAVLVWGLATGEMPPRRRRFRRVDNPLSFWAIAGALGVLAIVALWNFVRSFAWKAANSV